MLSRLRGPAARSSRQRGISLVELLVGLTVGLIVVAGASAISASQLSDTRRLLLETQIQQDLRAAADIMTRELRRTGSTAYNNASLGTIWKTTAPSLGTNAADITIASSNDSIAYNYVRTAGTANVSYGFRLNQNVIEFNLYGSGWQALTDSRTLRVTNLAIARTDGPAVTLPCPKPCVGGGTACFPTWRVRQLTVDIDGESVADPNIKRSIQTTIRVRNDTLSTSGLSQVCPA